MLLQVKQKFITCETINILHAALGTEDLAVSPECLEFLNASDGVAAPQSPTNGTIQKKVSCPTALLHLCSIRSTIHNTMSRKSPYQLSSQGTPHWFVNSMLVSCSFVIWGLMHILPSTCWRVVLNRVILKVAAQRQQAGMVGTRAGQNAMRSALKGAVSVMKKPKKPADGASSPPKSPEHRSPPAKSGPSKEQVVQQVGMRVQWDFGGEAPTAEGAKIWMRIWVMRGYERVQERAESLCV